MSEAVIQLTETLLQQFKRQMKIEAFKNALLYGAQLSFVPQFVKIYDQRAAEKLDEQVFSAMKKSLVRDHWAFCCLFSDVCCCMY
ncbi:hypothetical protein PAECIP112173_02162 [Paenibacillus sp. JJ-100]|nr:hypothetical protein PAECIP112173_02162 [Paenibacillus sp. JJ-100]